jgi:hypothetical protein
METPLGDRLITVFINPGRNVIKPENVSKEQHRQELNEIDSAAKRYASSVQMIPNIINSFNVHYYHHTPYIEYFALKLYSELKEHYRLECDNFQKNIMDEYKDIKTKQNLVFSVEGFTSGIPINKLRLIKKIVEFLFTFVNELNRIKYFDYKSNLLIFICNFLSNLLKDFGIVGNDSNVLRTFLLAMEDYNDSRIIDKKYSYTVTLSNTITGYFQSIYMKKNALIEEINSLIQLDIFPHIKYFSPANTDDLFESRVIYVRFKKNTWISETNIVYNDADMAKMASERELVYPFMPDTYYEARFEKDRSILSLNVYRDTFVKIPSSGGYFSNIFVGVSLVDKLCKELVTLYESVAINDITLMVRHKSIITFPERKGGSKKRRQIKQRQRKQKSKRKKN